MNILIVSHPGSGDREIFLIRDADEETLQLIKESMQSSYGGRLADNCANGRYEQVFNDTELDNVRIVNIFPA